MSESVSIIGGEALGGSVRVSGAKNAILPLVIASLLTDESCGFSNVPDLEDISVTKLLLEHFGARVSRSGNRLTIRAKEIVSTDAPYGLVKSMRASFWVLGPLLARCGEARVPLPGGDAIGARPVDMHLEGLTRMGADIRMHHGVVIASAPGGLTGKEISLRYPSVGATHHLMMTAALVPGETVIAGAAREPEVEDLALFLSRMGAEIEGAGSSTIRIVGRRELGGAIHEVLGDRIEASTFLFCVLMTGGRVNITGVDPTHLGAVLEVVAEMGAGVELFDSGIGVSMFGDIRPLDLETAPYPGLATDVQPLVMAALSLARGRSRIGERVFENRFGHVAEYRRLGANIVIEGDEAIVRGVDELSGAPVEATDIRAAAGLLLMGLAARGTTDISEVHHLDRGYDSIDEKLVSLGAKVRRVPAEERKELIYGC